MDAHTNVVECRGVCPKTMSNDVDMALRFVVQLGAWGGQPYHWKYSRAASTEKAIKIILRIPIFILLWGSLVSLCNFPESIPKAEKKRKGGG